jgi:ubiquinone/menaquinone biosynthesis C-methylase UbiE
MYEALLDGVALPAGSKLLDGGCGSGPLSGLAAERGLAVTGLDESASFIGLARRRFPQLTFVIGDLQALPFSGDSFDGIAGCNSFQYVPDRVRAVLEARRVLRDGGRIGLAVFDLPEHCEGAAVIGAVYSLLPASASGSPGPFAICGGRELEALLRDGGFEPEATRVVDTPWRYSNLETAVRAFISAGPGQHARAVVGEERLRDALRAALAPYGQDDGTYRLENAFVVAVGRKK